MEKKPWETLSTEVVNKNPWSEFRHDRFVLPNLAEGNYYYIHTPGSVCVVALTDEGKLVMIRGHRYLFKRSSLEFVSGGMKEGQTPLEAAHAELKEESGFTAREMKFLGKFAPSQGLLSEYAHVFFATGLTRGEQELEEGEDWQVELHSVEEVDLAMSSEEIWDGFALSSWLLARPHVVEYQSKK